MHYKKHILLSLLEEKYQIHDQLLIVDESERNSNKIIYNIQPFTISLKKCSNHQAMSATLRWYLLHEVAKHNKS